MLCHKRLTPGDLGFVLGPEPTDREAARWAHLGVNNQEAGALDIQAYVEMLKALTVFTVKTKRQREYVIMVVLFLGAPEGRKNSSYRPLRVGSQDSGIEEESMTSYWTNKEVKSVLTISRTVEKNRWMGWRVKVIGSECPITKSDQVLAVGATLGLL